MTNGVQQLEEGNYHDVVTVSNRYMFVCTCTCTLFLCSLCFYVQCMYFFTTCSVEGVKTRLDSLLSRLEGASSVATEAQEVVKVEGSIQQLEVWLVTCGKFAANQNILGQIEEHRVSD